MKKAIVLSVLGLTASGIAAFGQGAIAFNNYTSTSYQPVYYNPNPALAPTGLAGMNVDNPSVEIQVFYGLGDQTSDSISQFLSTAAAGGTSFIIAGANPGGSYKGNPATSTGGPGGYFGEISQVLPNWTSGDVTFLLLAWDSSSGATYATSPLTGNSGLFVQSNVVPTTGAPPPTPNIADNPAIMMSVPEPTTLAFGAMGALSLLAMARRKKV
jgi:PEP-CTERM motif